MTRGKRGFAIGAFLGGLALGVLLTMGGTIATMRATMISVHESTKDFDGTVKAIEASIKAAGWSMPSSTLMNATLKKQGVDFEPRVQLIKLCKAPYAAEVLADAPHMACLMPCTIAVYEDGDGTVRLSKMNTGLMGKVFGGTIARVMGGSVADDETKMLEGIIKR